MSTGCSPPGRAPPLHATGRPLLIAGTGAGTVAVAVAASASAVGEVDLHDRDTPAHGGQLPIAQRLVLLVVHPENLRFYGVEGNPDVTSNPCRH